MLHCKDCFHRLVCSICITGKEANKCIHFKDKKNFPELVSCKDCKYYQADTMSCLHYSKITDYMMVNDFCIDGERSNENDNG